MVYLSYVSSTLLVAAVAVTVQAEDLLTDITKIQRYWGQVSPYADNEPDYFGVGYVGLPDGCQIVSALIEASRFPADPNNRNPLTRFNATHNDFPRVGSMMVRTTRDSPPRSRTSQALQLRSLPAYLLAHSAS
jgi:hypothetical protein